MLPSLLAIALMAGAAQAPAPTGTIHGQVVEARTAAPLAAVLLQVESTRQRALSDPDGNFVLENVPVGAQSLLVSVVGFGLVRRQVVVVAGDVVAVTIPVAEGASTYVEDITVGGNLFRPAQTGAASQAVLGSRELMALRGVIADDPFRAVQVLPGVATGDDYRADFAVRGLGPAHVGLAIDDVDSRLLFHTVRGVADTGSLALINSDILEEATLLSGTHAQKLGAHLGARLDFRTRDGARDRLRVRAMVSGSATTTVWEGPLGDGTRGSWIVAARKSYIDWLLRRVDTSIDGTFGFIDGQAKLTLQPTAKQTLRLSVIGARSELNEDDDGGLNSFDRGQSRTLIGNAQWRFNASTKLAITQQLYVVDSQFRNSVLDGRRRQEGGDRDLTWRGSVEWSPSPRHFLEVGSQVQVLRGGRIERRFTSATAAVTTLDADLSTSAQAGWVSWRWSPSGKWTISPGVRAERWKLVNDLAASPWVLVEWQARATTRVRGGVGIQRQVPTFDDAIWARTIDRLVPERARIADLGIEQRFRESWRASATLYHRNQSDMLRFVNSEFRLVNGRVGRPVLAHIRNALDGSSRGVELTIERRSVNGLNGWLSYSLGQATLTDRIGGPTYGPETYAADFDQRHTLNANLAYRWSERSSVAARFRYGSNFPLQGYFEPRGDIHVLTESRNIARLPRYARFDLRADRTFTFRARRLTLFGEVINVLNRANYRTQSAALDPFTGEVFGLLEKLFPLLPSIGVLIEF